MELRYVQVAVEGGATDFTGGRFFRAPELADKFFVFSKFFAFRSCFLELYYNFLFDFEEKFVLLVI